MSKFKLKEATFPVRGQSVTVRELTQGERNDWVKATQEDRYRTFAFLMSKCCITPSFTEEEACQEPTDVADVIVDKILKLSGIRKEDVEPDTQSEPRGAANLSDGATSGTSAKRNN
jgi:hypothetical protein